MKINQSLIVMLLLSSCVESEDTITESSSIEFTPKSSFQHPLKSKMKNGLVLGLETKDSELGLRYAIEDSIHATENKTLKKSGVVEYQIRALSDREHQALTVGKAAPLIKETLPKLHPGLAQRVLNDSPVSMIPITIWLETKKQPSLTYELELAIGKGEINTRQQLFEKKRNLLQARAIKISQLQNELIADFPFIENQIEWRFKNLPALQLIVPIGTLTRLSSISKIVSIDELTKSEDQVVDGSEMANGTQITQFIDDGYDGDTYNVFNGSSWGVIELSGANYNHPVFLSSPNSNSSRIIQTRNCGGTGSPNSCSSYNWPSSSFGFHATAVTGIVAGDLRDGQDPTITSTLARIDRSGYAGESWGYVYRANYGYSRYDRVMMAYDDMINKGIVHVSNQSNGMPWNSVWGPGGDPNCTGRTNFSRAVNEAYEHGILPVIAAGNAGTSGTNCTINSPAMALGAFAVGSHGSNANTQNETTVRSGSISSYSSQSASTGRDMVDLTAYGCRRRLPTISNGYSTGNTCGTSFSAPTVVSGAMDFKQFYIATFSNWIDNPGVLSVNLLLMGDRQGLNGFTNSDLDRRWGAGRLKMRKFDNAGLDNPFEYKTGSVCVDHHKTVKIPMNGGNPLLGDVDYVKGVIHWYDDRHDSASSSQMDDIDFKLKKTNGTLLRTSQSVANNTERVFYSDPGGMAIELEIYGYNVSSDNTGCGTDSMRVYYAIYYEDNDRDDGNMGGIDSEY